MNSSYSAFVRSSQCSPGPSLTFNETNFQFTNFLTNVSYDKDIGLMEFQLRAFALQNITDVNSTTNMFTTMHLILKYVDEVIVDDYFRLCDYAQVDHSTQYLVPNGVFQGISSNSNIATASANISKSGPASTATTSSLANKNSTTNSKHYTMSTYNSSRLTTMTSLASISLTTGSGYARSTRLITSTVWNSNTVLVVDDESDDANDDDDESDDLPPDPDFVPVGIQKRILPRNLITDTYGAPETVVPEANSSGVGPPTIGMVSVSNSNNLGTCPIYKNNEIIITFPIMIQESSPFGSHHLQVILVSADLDHTVIGCTGSYVSTTQKDSLPKFLTYFSASLLGLIFASNMLSLILSPYQDSDDPFLFSASVIYNAPLLNQVNPGYVDFMHYMQYVFFMAALNLQYPGFFPPLITSIRWFAFLKTTNGIPATSVKNVYQTIYTAGLKAISNWSGDDLATHNWKYFLINISIYISISIFVYQVLLLLLTFIRTKTKRPTLKKFLKNSFMCCLSLIISAFMKAGFIPFLIHGLYLLTTVKNNPYGGPSYPMYHVWSIATSSVFLSIFIALITYYTIRFLITKRGREMMYKSLNVILVWSWLYAVFKTSRVSFIIIDYLEMVLFCISIGCLQSSATAQISVIIISQFIYLCLLLICKPYYSNTRMNRNKVAGSLAKIMISILHLPFIYSLNISETVRTRLIWGILIIHLIVIVFIYLVPTLQNLILSIKLYFNYKHGKKGTDIPDYREKGDHIELPLLDDTGYSFNLNSPYFSNGNSISSFSFFDSNDRKGCNNDINDIDFENNNPRTDEFGHESVSQSSEVKKTVSVVFSLNSSEIQLTDQRVLPGMSLNHSFLSTDTLKPSPITSNTFGNFMKSNNYNNSSNSRRDWASREVDIYYNAHRVLQPDPDVKRLWDDRGKKLDIANVTIQREKNLKSLNNINDETQEKSNEKENNHHHHQPGVLIMKLGKKIIGKKKNNCLEATGKGFEVFRSRPNMESPKNVYSSANVVKDSSLDEEFDSTVVAVDQNARTESSMILSRVPSSITTSKNGEQTFFTKEQDEFVIISDDKDSDINGLGVDLVKYTGKKSLRVIIHAKKTRMTIGKVLVN